MTHLDVLVEKIEAGQLAVFWGRDAPASLTNLPSGRDLAAGLTGESHSTSLVEATSNLKTHEYTSYLREKLAAAGLPGALHQALAALPISLWLTAAYDDRLADALKMRGRPPNLLVSNDDLGQRSLSRPNLVYLGGRVQGPGLLVVTEANHWEMPDQNRSGLFNKVSQWLEDKSILFVGCDPQPGGDFEQWLYKKLFRSQLWTANAESFLVWPDPKPGVVEHWANAGITLLTVEPLPFLAALMDGLAGVEVYYVDPEEPVLAALAKMLAGQPTQTEVDKAVGDLPPGCRPREIQVNWRFWLSQGDNLSSLLNVDYQPSTLHFHSLPEDSAITLTQLNTWADEAETLINQQASPDDSPVEQQGIAFYDALLPPGSKRRQRYELALLDAQRLKVALELSLELQDEKGRLERIPWELLYDKQVELGRGFLALNYPLYRLPATVSSWQQVAGRLKKALIVAADPTSEFTTLAQEVNSLRQTLLAAGVSQVDVRHQDHPDLSSPQAIKNLLRTGGYQLFHFTGHALFNPFDPRQSYLQLGRAEEADKILTAAELSQVVVDPKSQLVLVFLSACSVGTTEAAEEKRPWLETGLVDALTRSGVPAVVAMRWEVGEQSALTMAQTFYTALCQHRESPQKALMLARQSIPLAEPHWMNPILTKLYGVL